MSDAIFKKQVKIGFTLDEAIEEAIKYCIDNNVLKEFLIENSSEVRNMLLVEFNLDTALRIEREEGKEEGKEEGITIGKVIAFRKIGLSDSTIMKELQLSKEDYNRILEQIESDHVTFPTTTNSSFIT